MPRRKTSHTPADSHFSSGHSLIELLVVLSFLGACFAIGGVVISRGLSSVEARGTAQAWQAAATWAQANALWQAVPAQVSLDQGSLAVVGEASGADCGKALPSVPILSNVVRWQQGQGVVVRFVAGSGSPDSAGSLFFRSSGGDYRVTVRLESGLTVRTLERAGS